MATRRRISVLTFNVLAPCWKRFRGSREAEFPEVWKQRQLRCLELIKSSKPDVIAIQEYWFQEEFESMYRKHLDGYNCFSRQRAGRKPDGVSVFARADTFQIIDDRSVVFHGAGNRCAVLCRLRFLERECSDFLLVNTHLTFPHDDFDHINRSKQVDYLSTAIDDYLLQRKTRAMSIILCGDFNGDTQDPVCHHLARNGYKSSYGVMNGHEPVTHRTHLNTTLGVDFIFLRQLQCFLSSSDRPESAQRPETFSRMGSSPNITPIWTANNSARSSTRSSSSSTNPATAATPSATLPLAPTPPLELDADDPYHPANLEPQDSDAELPEPFVLPTQPQQLSACSSSAAHAKPPLNGCGVGVAAHNGGGRSRSRSRGSMNGVAELGAAAAPRGSGSLIRSRNGSQSRVNGGPTSPSLTGLCDIGVNLATMKNAASLLETVSELDEDDSSSSASSGSASASSNEGTSGSTTAANDCERQRHQHQQPPMRSGLSMSLARRQRASRASDSGGGGGGSESCPATPVLSHPSLSAAAYRPLGSDSDDSATPGSTPPVPRSLEDELDSSDSDDEVDIFANPFAETPAISRCESEVSAYKHKERASRYSFSAAIERTQSSVMSLVTFSQKSKASHREYDLYDTDDKVRSTHFLEPNCCPYKPVSSVILPLDYEPEVWPNDFDLSDHRPLLSTFELEHRPSCKLHGENACNDATAATAAAAAL